MRKSISDYTETQFVQFLQDHLDASDKGMSEEALNNFLYEFCELTGHPDGTDLIYYPEPGADDSVEGITQTVKAWRAVNGLPGFKDA
ncbi:bacteriocin immunity protein [Pseudomonas sp. SDO528_S397]